MTTHDYSVILLLFVFCIVFYPHRKTKKEEEDEKIREELRQRLENEKEQ